MVKKSRCYFWCAGGLVAGLVAGALVAAYSGIPAIGRLAAKA
jgi:hypothetical protein